MIKIAVIQFPGSNCEFETARAVESVGMKAEIFRWNKEANLLKKYDGYLIGGGFSYQDRVRAGVIAAKEPIMEQIVKEQEKGKPVLGICNGAQILVESGIIPGIEKDEIEMALSPNKMEKQGKIVRRDYYCTWVYLKHSQDKKRCAATFLISENEILPIPIAHGEGRFTTTKKDLLKKLIKNKQIIFRYCDEEGNINSDFPINPNGSIYNIAGICNPKGNVLAMMPHPERANWLRQIPQDLKGHYGEKRRKATGNFTLLEDAGPGRIIFQSIKKYIEEK